MLPTNRSHHRKVESIVMHFVFCYITVYVIDPILFVLCYT